MIFSDDSCLFLAFCFMLLQLLNNKFLILKYIQFLFMERQEPNLIPKSRQFRAVGEKFAVQGPFLKTSDYSPQPDSTPKESRSGSRLSRIDEDPQSSRRLADSTVPSRRGKESGRLKEKKRQSFGPGEQVQREQFRSFLKDVKRQTQPETIAQPSRLNALATVSQPLGEQLKQLRGRESSKLVISNNNGPLKSLVTPKYQQKRPQTTQNKRRMITQQYLDKDAQQRQDSSTLAGTTSIGSPSQVTTSLAPNVAPKLCQPLYQSSQYSNVLQQHRRTKSTQNKGNQRRGMIMSGSTIKRPLLVATSSPFFQGNINQQEISFDGKAADHTMGFLSGAMLMNKDGELNDIGGNWLNEKITPQSMMRGRSAAERIFNSKRPMSSLVATRAHQAQVKQRLRILSSNQQPQVSSRPESMNYFSGEDIRSSQSRSANNQTQTIKAPSSQKSHATYQHFPCKSPLARVQRRFDETLNCLEYSIQQAVQFDMMESRSTKSKPGILSHEDKEPPVQQRHHT